MHRPKCGVIVELVYLKQCNVNCNFFRIYTRLIQTICLFYTYTHTRPSTALVSVCSSTDNMSFLDIKDPAERATAVKEYVTATKTVKQRNMLNREMKLAIGDELQTLFHPIANATKQD